VDGDGSNNCCIIPEYYDLYRKVQKNLNAPGGFSTAASAPPKVIQPDRYSFIIISAPGRSGGTGTVPSVNVPVFHILFKGTLQSQKIPSNPLNMIHLPGFPTISKIKDLS